MAKESTWVFPLLGLCSKLKELKQDCRHLPWSKYSCILSSIAFNSPFTWPAISLKFENMFTAFSSSF